jgi:hypothetical protein
LQYSNFLVCLVFDFDENGALIRCSFTSSFEGGIHTTEGTAIRGAQDKCSM